jgi:signal transduction histidine kinase
LAQLSAKSKATLLLLLFPPLVLLVYAFISYYISSYTQQKSLEVVKKSYAFDLRNRAKKDIQADAYIINNYIDVTDGEKRKLLEYLEIFKDSLGEKENIILLDSNNRVIYSMEGDRKNREVLAIVKKNGSGIYEDSRFFIFTANNNILGYRVVSYFIKSKKGTLYEDTLEDMVTIYQKSIQSQLLWLLVAFIVLLLFSLLLSYLLYHKIKEYEKGVEADNNRVIFQSRQALLGELLPMIAHQWRQPLNKIAAVLMRMRFEISGGKPKVETLDMQCQSIEDSVELMSETIEDFRTFYRPKEVPQEVDLALLIRKGLYFLDELLQRKKISIHTDLEPVKAKLYANEFLQVIINIIKNASDAVSVQGNIYITLRKIPGDGIEIRIEDDGVGIPKEKLEHIFEAHESSKQGSMGLGLYMSKIIIEQRFKGKISAYNTSRGAGFYIYLPAFSE